MRMRPPEVPNLNHDAGSLPLLANFMVGIAILEQRCAKPGKNLQPEKGFSTSAVACAHRAGAAPWGKGEDRDRMKCMVATAPRLVLVSTLATHRLESENIHSTLYIPSPHIT